MVAISMLRTNVIPVVTIVASSMLRTNVIAMWSL